MASLIVRGVYDYRATGEDEIDVKEGSLIQLTTGPQGGQKYGEGWWEGQYFIAHSPPFGEVHVEAPPNDSPFHLPVLFGRPG
jgi:hypothetical protein